MDQEAFHGCKLALFVGDQLLCILRDDIPNIPFPNMWDFPGGGREGSETPDETIARELDEELGLDFAAVEVLWHVKTPAAHTPGEMVCFYVGRLPEGAEQGVRFGDEGQRWALFDVDEVLRRADVVPSLSGRLRSYLGLKMARNSGNSPLE